MADTSKQIRIIAGINSINFFKGYDPETNIFDNTRTHTQLYGLSKNEIYQCFTDEGEVSKVFTNKDMSKVLLGWGRFPSFLPSGNPAILPMGNKLVMSGLVATSDLYDRGIGYNLNTPQLKVDKLYQFKNPVIGNAEFVDVSDLL